MVILALGLAGYAPAASMTPPQINIPAAGPLGPGDIAQLTKRMQYWADQIVKATTPADVTAAGLGARNDYRLYTSRDYQYRFAEVAGRVLGPILNNGIPKDDKLRRLKEVNLALILSRIPQVNIMSALKAMVTHSNPAVRYLGWEGFRTVRTQILAQSPQFAQTMLDTLSAAAAKETAAPTVGAIFEMADISSLSSEAIPTSTLQKAQQQMFKLLADNWLTWCRRVMVGEAEMSRSCQKAPAAIKTLAAAQAAGPAAGPASKTKALQMLLDLSYSAAKAYDFSAGQGPIAKENTLLLRICESAMADLSGKDSNYFIAALADKTTVDHGAAVRGAVFKWADDLKALGVVEPKIKPAPSKPATVKPAAKPVAKPAGAAKPRP